jgi:hypothetical protein
MPLTHDDYRVGLRVTTENDSGQDHVGQSPPSTVPAQL